MSDSEQQKALRGQAPGELCQDGSLVLGSWEGIPGRANLIDVHRPYHYPLPRFLRGSRIKEWQAIQAGNADCFIFAVFYDAKYLGMVSVDIWDRKNKRKAGFRHNFPGRRFTLPESLEKSHLSHSSGHRTLSLSIDMEAETMRLQASNHPKNKSDFSFDLDLSFALDKDSSPAFSVCLPLGLNRAMYSTKILMPCSGSLVLDGERRELAAEKTLGVLDDHKGYYPYRLHYDWVTGFGIEPSGRRVGFNLTDNQVKDQLRYNENRLWIGSAVHTLPPIRITRPYGRSEPWIIQDTQGMVDLIFHPEVPHDITMNLGLADIDYSGPFGRFEGILRSSSGEKIDASRLYGMGEDKNLRL
ncbi:MAG: DUF2804 domain-containing protein [Spirochaetia bacterium]|nr:DUF2804 domain-containing protein [Spirochaetales bacterium]MDX9783612.1 DUF2804 domain-containing protein [Spirochaetia bacterium]